jgi:hypothetical protein
MRPVSVPGRAAAFLLMVWVLPVAADSPGPATRLSAALGGCLGDGMSDAGGIGHGRFEHTAPRRLGRAEQYRRQVTEGRVTLAGLPRRRTHATQR